MTTAAPPHARHVTLPLSLRQNSGVGTAQFRPRPAHNASLDGGRGALLSDTAPQGVCHWGQSHSGHRRLRNPPQIRLERLGFVPDKAVIPPLNRRRWLHL